MKTTKRIISITIALVLGLTLLVPAMAAQPVDPNAPIITKLHARHISGTTVALAVEAKLPEGATGELSYHWYLYENMFSSKFVAEGANPTVEIARRPVRDHWDFSQAVESFLATATYYVVVTNTYTDDEGNTQTATIDSDGIRVAMALPLRDTLSEYWEFGSDGRTNPVGGTVFMVITSPVLFPAFMVSRFLHAITFIVYLFR